MSRNTRLSWVTVILVFLAATAPTPTFAHSANIYPNQVGEPNLAQTTYSILSYTYNPYVIPAGTVSPITLTVHTDGSVTSMTAALQAGGTVAATAVNASTFQLVFTPAQVLFNYATANNHNFFGLLNVYSGAVLQFSLNLVVNVSDSTIPSITPVNLATDARAATHVVNLLIPSATPGIYDANIIARFYQLYPDSFDFINQVYVDNTVKNRTHTIVSNDIQGIGLNIYNSSSSYGSSGRLKGITNFPIATFFDGADYAYQHEIGHQWINYTTIPGGPHWPISELAQGMMGLSIPGSNVGGDFPFDMSPNGNGSYTLHLNYNKKSQVGFTDLDLYLMGLLPASQVQPALVFSNQSQSSQLNDGGILQGPTYTVDANTIIATSGPRIPESSAAQKNFFAASIIITRDRLLTDQELAFFDYMAARASFTQAVPYSSGWGSGIVQPFYLSTRTLGTLTSTMLTTFADVHIDYWANGFVERLYHAGITGGCTSSPLNYCPDNTVTRAQMAVFLLKGMHGSGYTPPAVGGSTGFGDVPTNYWAAAWVKQLAAEGLTSGCGGGNYCPDATVTRAQMAIFLLKAKNGSSYTPPAVGGSTGFNDVPTSYWAAPFIKQLVSDGITSGCGGGNYCPDNAVTRAQMAVFLVKAFNLP